MNRDRNGSATIILIGIVLIAAIIGAGFWYYKAHQMVSKNVSQPATTTVTDLPTSTINTNMPSSTVGWITYTNDTFDYKIQYPSNWFINTDNSDYVAQNGGTDGETGWSNYQWGSITGPPVPSDYHVIGLEIYDIRTYPNAISLLLPTSTNGSVHVMDIQPVVTQSGATGTEYIDIEDNGHQQPSVAFQDGNYIYQFSTDLQSESLMNQMISTFALTNI